jgi:hypothetical protein
MRRSDRAARLAALQAEVAVLRATIAELRDELGTARAQAAVAAQEHAVALTAALAPTGAPSGLQWLSMDLPVVAPEAPELTAAALPEAALLDPKQDRDETIDLTDAPSLDLTDDAEATRRIA